MPSNLFVLIPLKSCSEERDVYPEPASMHPVRLGDGDDPDDARPPPAAGQVAPGAEGESGGAAPLPQLRHEDRGGPEAAGGRGRAGGGHPPVRGGGRPPEAGIQGDGLNFLMKVVSITVVARSCAGTSGARLVAAGRGT